MFKKYEHRNIEKDIQKKWKENKIYETNLGDNSKEKFYLLDMWPYPSGDGLHMGHVESYSITDTFYRYKRMKGFNVLHPQGFDSFGLPAENFAVKTGTHPMETTKKNSDNYLRQWGNLGMGHDFSKLVDSSNSETYKHTQSLFGKFLENDLVYKKTAKANWCSSCNTIIANEQIEGGACERCGTDIEQKDIPSWMFRITDFADDLIWNEENEKKFGKVDWPEHTKKNQNAWIGKSQGANIEFEVKFEDKKIEKKDILLLHGWEGGINTDFFPWLKKKLEKKDYNVFIFNQPNTETPNFNDWFDFVENKIQENNLKDFSILGHSMGGHLALKLAEKYKINQLSLIAPVGFEDKESEYFNQFKDKLSKDEIDIFKNYQNRELNIQKVKDNTEEINFIFGKKDPWITKEIQNYYIDKFSDVADIQILDQYAHMSEDEGVKEIDEIEQLFVKEKIEVFTTRPDTLFGATYMVLAPEHNLVQEWKNQIENWDEVEKYISNTKKKTELDRLEGKEKTGVELKGIKAINPANQEELPIFISDYVLAGYGTGAIMAVPAHDERDNEFANNFNLKITSVIEPVYKKYNDIEKEKLISEWKETLKNNRVAVFSGDGVLVNSGKFDGMDSEEAKEKITKFVGGEITSTYRLRDWSISRQRYWGTPIPVVYSPEGEAKFVGEENLPWKLPTDVDFIPTGEAPLAKSKELFERTENLFGKGWTPEVDTMDTFVDSSWYFLRYIDSENTEKFASEERLKKWMPVDLYIGGAEHTYMHLLYARFFTRAMEKMGLIDFKEPFLKLRHQGMVNDIHGKKMSKSKGNVVNPDEMVERFGADATRAYMLFAGPIADDVQWNEDNIVGVYRWIEKIWRQQEKLVDEENLDFKKQLHKTIKSVGEHMESLRFNVAISDMMKLMNFADKEKEINKEDYLEFVKISSVFIPHVAENIFLELGGEGFLLEKDWPKFNKELIVDDVIIMAVQVNGKKRGDIEINPEAGEDEVVEISKTNPEIAKWLDAGEIKKVVYIPGRILNFVVK